ncbi:hypothetical protein [Aureimonas sp. ME7]|uniref:hypothetical protein n=1 Tax=Aureimonas sp. ME7 TaxID=2744252 RepID=UPI0015F3D132|nr:hypothetical protein [Aureimonas sp. ME7]
MGDLDTDSQMMRRQQAQDAPETIPADETQGQAKATDSDPESRAAREAAKAAKGETGEWAEDAVLRQNRAGLSERREGEASSRQAGGEASLANPGRSLLKD